MMTMDELLQKLNGPLIRQEAIDDLRALHGINGVAELASVAQAEAEHSKSLGAAFANAVMGKLKEEGMSEKIFKPTPFSIPEEWFPRIAALQSFLERFVNFIKWTDEIQLGQVEYSLQIAPHKEGTGDYAGLDITLSPCDKDHFARMQIKERCPVPLKTFVGDTEAILRIECAKLPRYIVEWIAGWMRDEAYAASYRLKGWGIHTNHMPPREHNLHVDALQIYHRADKRIKQDHMRSPMADGGVEAAEELITWVNAL